MSQDILILQLEMLIFVEFLIQLKQIQLEQFFIMQIIIKETIKHFKYQKKIKDDALLNFIKHSQFYEPEFSEEKILESVKSKLYKSDTPELRRLEYHFTKENNQQLFQIYEIILDSPKGISYMEIRSILKQKVDIITISHYCRKLCRKNFIDVKHEKDGIKVIAKIYENKQSKALQEVLQEQQQPIIDIKDSFLIRQLSMSQNILLNVQGVEALLKEGLTKEQICSKLLKVSEKKTISRLIENMGIEKVGERKGKIYQFKFKGNCSLVQSQINNLDKKRDPSSVLFLKPEIEKWLQNKFPEITVKNILLELVNNHIKQYTSSVGKKQHKRQCTPLKLNRYIYILNQLQQGGQTQYNLRTMIIEKEKSLNTGTMHKRSLIGILTGLQQLGIVEMQDQIVYPKWKSVQKIMKQEDPKPKRNAKQFSQTLVQSEKTKKKIKIQHGKVMNESKYLNQLCTSLLTIQLNQGYQKSIKYAFYKIKKFKYNQKINKQQQKSSIIHILQKKTILSEIQYGIESTFQKICRNIDSIIQPYLQPQNVQLDEDFKRYMRIHPKKKIGDLFKRFGKAYLEKCNFLVSRNWMQVEGNDLTSLDSTYKLTLPDYIYLI